MIETIHKKAIRIDYIPSNNQTIPIIDAAFFASKTTVDAIEADHFLGNYACEPYLYVETEDLPNAEKMEKALIRLILKHGGYVYENELEKL